MSAEEADAPAPGWTVTLVDGTRIPVPPGTDLVSAARAAGWRWPKSCRNGTCRTCRARVIEGQAVHRIEWPGLSREELAEGWILPCVAEPRSDLRVDALSHSDTMTLKPR
ncbi:2Fe-2S iron-sulfur cluster-binding protein [Leptothrix sp. BB-4]